MKFSADIKIELYKKGSYDLLTTVDGKENSKQTQALQYLNDTITRELLFGGAKGGGKSFLGAEWLIMQSIIYPETQWFVAREQLTDLRKWTIPTFNEAAKNIGLENTDYKFNGQDNFFEFYNKSRIYFLAAAKSPSDPLFERFGSMQNTGGWIEEGGEIDEKAYENLKLSIGRCKNKEYGIPFKLLITANPKKNWMYMRIIRPLKENKLPENIKYIQSFAKDNPGLSPEYLDTLEQITDKIDRQRLLLGIWDYDAEDGALVNFDKLCDMFTNSFVPDEGQTYLTIDVAITNDRFVCYAWKGLRVKEIRSVRNVSKPISIVSESGEWINKIDFSPLVKIINEMCDSWAIPRSNIAYDADGGLGAKMIKLIPGAVPINNGRTSIRPGYKNLSTELGYKLAELINGDQIYYDCAIPSDLREQIIDELQTSLKRSSEIGDKLALTPKSEVKSILSRSPDLYDAKKYRCLFMITRGK